MSYVKDFAKINKRNINCQLGEQVKQAILSKYRELYLDGAYFEVRTEASKLTYYFNVYMLVVKYKVDKDGSLVKVSEFTLLEGYKNTDAIMYFAPQLAESIYDKYMNYFEDNLTNLESEIKNYFESVKVEGIILDKLRVDNGSIHLSYHHKDFNELRPSIYNTNSKVEYVHSKSFNKHFNSACISDSNAKVTLRTIKRGLANFLKKIDSLKSE